MKKKIIKSLSVLLLVVTLLPLNGCWDAVEFDQLALIKGIAIDPAEENDRFKFTVEMVRGGGGGGGNTGSDSGQEKTETEQITSTGYSLYEANRNLIKQTGHIPYYGHNELILINEELARKGIGPMLDFLLRNKEIRGRNNIAISRGAASDILEKSHYLDPISATGIKIMLDGGGVAGTIITSELISLRRQLLNKYHDPAASSIELRPGGPPPPDSPAGSEQGKNLIFAEGGAVFKGDKLVAWLTRKEARGYNWILNPNDIRGPIIINRDENQASKRLAVEIYRGKGSIIPHFDGKNFSISIEVETEGMIIENLEPDYILTESNKMDKLNKRFAQVVNNEIFNALEKGRKHRADLLGLAEAIYQKYPKEFKKVESRWDEIYATIPVNIKVKAQIRRTGMIK